MSEYYESARSIPVVGDVDVLVAGGGPGAIGAALAAARNGARTMIVEQCSCLGGVATSGMMSHWTGNSESPFLEEIKDKAFTKLWNCEEHNSCNRNSINHEKYKLLIIEMLEEAGVTIQLHTLCADVIMDGNTIKGVITESKSGREAILAKVVIDGTGDGDIACKAGAEYYKGRESDGVMQPVTLMFKLAGVDFERAVFPGSFETLVDTPNGELQALARKYLPAPAGHVLLYKSPIKGHVVVNMTNLTNIDGTNVRDLTAAEIQCRKQIPQIISFLQKYAPGYESCYHIATADCVGVRETRHFKGVTQISEDDIINARIFDDWIATRCSFNFDIHNLKGAGLDENGRQKEFRAKGKYTIPLGVCLPAKIDRLLLTGRNISGTHKAHSNFRAMPICLNIGQGVGTVAAVAVVDNVTPRNTNIKKIQKLLNQQGVRP